ncbi:PH domain-containing protein [Tsukamurella soli]|uniref:PH domain-containing protein n=1 Tax=Tsukamurella soli TaxID=644556 RepID=A0ABP8JDX5_9ACTN
MTALTQPPGNPLRPPAHRVSPRARTWWAVRAAAPWLVVTVVVAAALAAATGPSAWLVLASVPLGVGVVHATVMPRWRFAFHRWEVTPEAVYAQTGWLTRTRVLIPVSRVQVIDTVAGPLERAFGLATLTVTTASSAGTVHVPGLERAVAESVATGLTIGVAGDRDDAT